MLTREQLAYYLERKAEWSKQIDEAASHAGKAPRRDAPHFATPQEAWNYIQAHGNPYTGDPLWGVGDYYLSPSRLVAALETDLAAINRLHIDCDDIAGLAYVMLRDATDARLVTLYDAGLVGSHVIAIFKTPDGKFWAIDTCGLRELPDVDEETLCREWRLIYSERGYNYTMAVDSPYPF